MLSAPVRTALKLEVGFTDDTLTTSQPHNLTTSVVSRQLGLQCLKTYRAGW